MNRYIVNTGWKMDPGPKPYIAYMSKEITSPKIIELNVNSPITIKVAANEPKFCIGFTNDDREHVPCPFAELIPLNKVQCQSCSFNEFFVCRSYCIGEFCQPSSETAKDHCWNTTANVYLTYIAGKLKVGSSTSTIRRLIDQGSIAGIKIAIGTGLDPRALEHQIATRFSLPLAIRMSQKFKFLGVPINKDDIVQLFSTTIDEIYSSIKSDILIPKDQLEKIRFFDEYYGNIPTLKGRPLIKELTSDGLEISGEIVGVQGSILVVKNNETYFATNLNSIVGLHLDLKEEVIEMKGQKSLFDFV
ncbi:MAG: DUF2797 domain-containing protein [Asgard group archaeon]|nr:DUF2797 domain-containing protein [Asgard group archaeon]